MVYLIVALVSAAAALVTTPLASRLSFRLGILAEPGDLAQTISAWQTRTQAFIAKNPGREGWSDAQGHAWNASQVLALLTDVQQRLDALKQPDEFEEEGE